MNAPTNIEITKYFGNNVIGGKYVREDIVVEVIKRAVIETMTSNENDTNNLLNMYNLFTSKMLIEQLLKETILEIEDFENEI